MISILQIYLQADVELKTAETAGQEVAGAEEESVEEICETCESVEQPQILADQQVYIVDTFHLKVDPSLCMNSYCCENLCIILFWFLLVQTKLCNKFSNICSIISLVHSQAESESRARPRSLSKMVDY